MDEKRKPGASWMDDTDSDDLGATGMFSAVSGGGYAPSLPDPPAPVPRPLPAPVPVAAPAANVREPVVHKVGPSAGPVNLLELLRSNTTALDSGRQPRWPEPPVLPNPAPAGVGQPAAPSEGFTQLLRALGGDARPPVAAAPSAGGFTSMLENVGPSANAWPPLAPASAPVQVPVQAADGGFTALLQGVPQAASAYAPAPLPPAPLPPAPLPPALLPPALLPPAPRYNPAVAENPGGFTQLLQGFQPDAAPASLPQAPVFARPEAAWPLPAAPAPPVSSGPGSFTQLFGSVASAPEPPLPAAPPAYRPTVASGDEPSFTQVMSRNEPYSPAHGQPPSGQSPRPFAGYDPEPRRFAEAAPILPERPAQSDFAAGGAGMTQMLRRLQVQPEAAPFRPTELSPAYAPPAVPAVPGPDTSFSGLYGSLSGTPPPQPARAPGTPYSPPPNPYFEPAPAPAMPLNPQQPARGEVTTILEMSKLREMARQGAAAAAMPQSGPQSGPATLQGWSPQMPPAPAMPPATLPAMAAPQYAPPQYAPPQYVPPAVPALPPVPAAPAPSAPKGGMQQYIPLFLMAIIFLLVVILITVVFLLKH